MKFLSEITIFELKMRSPAVLVTEPIHASRFQGKIDGMRTSFGRETRQGDFRPLISIGRPKIVALEGRPFLMITARSTPMGIRIATSIVLALTLLGLAAMTSLPLSAQEPSRTKIDVPRDDIDKILVEAKENKESGIEHIKTKIRELEKKQDDLLYELINTRAKLKRAVEGLEELDPSQKNDPNRIGPNEDDSVQSSKRNVLRPRPNPRTPQEKDELLKKYEDEASIASKLESESRYFIKYLEALKFDAK